jgi:TonB-linked SusC/RagA family outer membrane protein
MEPVIGQLEGVVVNTGYQSIPKERATGSFVQIDRALLNRRISPDIISRLEGVASGLSFNANIPTQSKESPFSIRGRSTITANTQPLIVLDNFPYDGDLNSINPNNIESITLLKDAAAASIWGARAGNGVIVINTRKGGLNRPLSVELVTNYTFSKKPDLFYNPNFLNASSYIDFEQYLFSLGSYDADLNNTTTRPPLSPAVELMARKRAGLITQSDLDAQLNTFRGLDFRNDLTRYWYRPALNRQYAVSLSGGSDKTTYFFSAGYDDNLATLVGNSFKRLTVDNQLHFSLAKNLQFGTGFNYTNTRTTNNNTGNPIPNGNRTVYYPYAQLADANGNALPLARDFRFGFIDTAGGGKLLDWKYRPLDELNLADNTSLTDYVRITPQLGYRVLPGLSVELKYQYEHSFTGNRNLQSVQSYYTRSLVNQFTQGNGKLPVPAGDILDRTSSDFTGHSFRAQVSINKTFGKHSIVAVAGNELKELITHSSSSRLYGYDNNITTNKTVNYDSIFTKYANIAGAGKIPYNESTSYTTTEFGSWFGNAAYTYNQRYLFSASARIDKSNLFGVSSNLKAIPLWSMGLGWNISQEKFYHSRLLPLLNVRLTYGYNGNLDRSLAAYTTAVYSTSSLTGVPYALVQNPPNPSLSWEKTRMINASVNFATIHQTLSGSIELYWKKGTDLLGNAPLDPTTGVTSFKGNLADMSGKGIDINLQSKNLRGPLFWSTYLLVSYTTDKVTGYKVTTIPTIYIQAGDGSTNSINPVVGYPVYSLSAYRWAGLDPQTGAPMGYVSGQVSKDYTALAGTNVTFADLVYKGPARPEYFGSVRNEFSYKRFSLSVNISFKLQYFFRRPSVQYSNLAGGWLGNNDFDKRWQKPGDELTTNVPAFVYPQVTARNSFYQYSEVLVEKGDHIRLQDVRLSYDVPSKNKFFSELSVYAYANNLGLLWKANHAGLDPDFVSQYSNTIYPNPASLSLGVRVKW